MKIPALRAHMGEWTYYVGTLTFKQISEHVSKVDEELHKSENLKDLIQRSITSNFLSIKEYIIEQPERFFNGIILAVYDEYPDWRQIEIEYDDYSTVRLGVLDFPGKHKIFPLDGQHRVEGIKAALKENPSLASEEITAIFVGHKNDEAGMKKSRRLFSTLNRYAKPVTMDDIIALDEDDSVAIATRYLIEDVSGFELFKDDRLTKSKNKAIPDSDKDSFTSIITLYQCNKELLKFFRSERKKKEPNSQRDKKSAEDYLKFRPEEIEVKLFQEFCRDFWKDFAKEIGSVKSFLSCEGENKAIDFRVKKTGGNLLFRPVGLLPFVQAIVEIKKRKRSTFKSVLSRFNKVDYSLDQKPWKSTLWNPIDKTMIMGTMVLVKLLFLYMYGQEVIRESEIQKLKEKYAAKLNLEEGAIGKELGLIPKIPK